MNYFKHFLIGLLTLSMAPVYAMEPAQQLLPTEPSKPSINSKLISGIHEDDLCPICIEKAQSFAADQLRLTTCCGNFICANDANEIYERAQATAAAYQTREQKVAFIAERGFAPVDVLKALCPLCKKELKTVATFLSSNKNQSALTIIDSEGIKFDLEPQLAQAFLTCNFLEAYEDHPEVLDFSNINSAQKRILKKDYIFALAQLIVTPIVQREKLPKIVELFELGKYCMAPDNILFILANELWLQMQDQENDTKAQKDHKKLLRELAKPHLASPRTFLAYLKTVPQILFKEDLTPSGVYADQKFKLSYTNVKQVVHKKRVIHQDERIPGGWYLDDKGCWCYAGYQFHTLDGISELINFLAPSNTKSCNIDLSGHALETFSCDIVKRLDTLDLSNNNIKLLTGEQCKHKDRLPNMILRHNPISNVDESFFSVLRKARAQNPSYCNIELQGNKLSVMQKAEIRKKFYKAITTLPERHFNRNTFEKYFAIGGAAIGCASSLLASYYVSQKAPTAMKGISLTSSALVGGALGSLRELAKGHYNSSGKWMAFDIAAGLLGAAFASNYAYDKAPLLIQAIPTTIGALAGAVIGSLGGYIQSNIIASTLAKFTHPQIGFRDSDTAWMGAYHYTIEL